mmetsp:Transcript_26307/g.73837  ORF Transcript_26307/g.73837 Transcript_26307/m.73837 type:complete len:558 (-) Transcript_26307:282-1955(-)
MRSTAVVQLPDGQHVVVCKGSPERVAEVSKCKSLPEAFSQELQRLMSQGARCVVLAAAYLEAEGQAADLPRAELEARMELIGIAAMSAPIKEGTAATISALREAAIRTFMVTGDHMATAVHTARKAGMLPSHVPVVCIEEAVDSSNGQQPSAAFPFLAMSVLPPESDLAGPEGAPDSDEAEGAAAITISMAGTGQLELLQMAADGRAGLAVTGKALAAAQKHSALEALRVVYQRGAVFARMLPSAKASLISAVSSSSGEEAQQPVSKVGFVGDGANDIMALREAHVGLSLCEAEASIAAPLTSKEQSPWSIVKAIAEGRAALSCSYETVQYIVIYAFIQVLGLNVLYFHDLVVGDLQYLIQDLLFVTTTSALMGYTGPKSTLSVHRPADRLLTWETTSFVVVQIAAVTVFQLLAQEVLQTYGGHSGAEPQPPNPESQSPEGSVVFVMSLWQLVTAGLLTNRTTPFRRSAFSNPLLVLALSLQAAFTLLLVLLPGGPGFWLTWKLAQLVPLPRATRIGLLGLMALYTMCSWTAGQAVHCLASRTGRQTRAAHIYAKLA